MSNNHNLEHVSFPATSFDDGAFEGCSSLVSISLPQVESFSNYAFEDCTSLTAIYLPLVESFGDNAFYGCDHLLTADLPQAITFGDSTFGGCIDLVTVDLPKVANFGDNAFRFCFDLEVVNLPKVASFGDNAFYNCSDLITIELPELVTLGNYAFAATNIKSINLPKVTTLGTDFASEVGSGFQLVQMPALATIGGNAFRGSGDSPFVLVMVLGAVPPATVDSTTFSAYNPLSSMAVVRVPSLSTALYDAADSISDGLWYDWDICTLNAPAVNEAYSDGSSRTVNCSDETALVISLSGVFADADGDSLIYEVSEDGIAYQPFAGETYTFDHGGAIGGAFNLYFRAYDGYEYSNGVYQYSLTFVDDVFPIIATNLTSRNVYSEFLRFFAVASDQVALESFVITPSPRNLTDSAGEISYQVQLEAGRNVILMTATDTAGNVTTKSFNVNYHEDSIGIYFPPIITPPIITEPIIPPIIIEPVLPPVILEPVVPIEQPQKVITMTLGESLSFVDGQAQVIGASPIMVNNEVFVPIRFLGETLGAKVNWIGATKQIEVLFDGHSILLTIDSAEVLVDGESIIMESPARLDDGSTRIQLDWLPPILGVGGYYDSVTGTINVSRLHL